MYSARSPDEFESPKVRKTPKRAPPIHNPLYSLKWVGFETIVEKKQYLIQLEQSTMT